MKVLKRYIDRAFCSGQDDFLVVYERGGTFHIAWGDTVNKPTVTGDCEETVLNIFKALVKEYGEQHEQRLNEQALRVTGKPRTVLDWEMRQYLMNR
jgi:hypothetical protein